MKLPYKIGDSFALPLGNGQFARSCIVQCEHRVVVIRVTIGDGSWLDLRVSDDALVLHRWKRGERVDLDGQDEPRPQNSYWMHAARAERIAAAAAGAPHPRERKTSVREVRDDNAAGALTGLDDDSVLAMTQRVSMQTLERARSAIFNHPGITVRLSSGAAAHLDVLSTAPITRLTLAGPVKPLPAMSTVRHLILSHPYDLASVVAAFPNLDSLRIAARAAVRLRDLRALPGLQTLDLSLVNVSDASQFADLAHLQALRLNRTTGVRGLEAIADLSLRTLAVEHLHELERVDALARSRSLQQLEFVGLWQFDIADVVWALECERLKRAEIDIGGRRKNLELYRRAHWAYPWRFSHESD